MGGLIDLFKFSTKFPVGNTPIKEDASLGKSMKFFPIVGMIIGIILFGCYMLTIKVLHNTFTLGVILICIETILSGGIHLKGLAATFDSVFSYRSKQKMLDRMKEDKISVNGALVLGFAILIKTVTVSESGIAMGVILLTMPVMGRLGAVMNCVCAPGARSTGVGKMFADNTSAIDVVISTVLSCAYLYGVLMIFSRYLGMDISGAYKLFLVVPISLICGAIHAKWMKQKIGGITSDTIGAIVELIEVITAICIYILMFFPK